MSSLNGSTSKVTNIALMMISGLFVNGPCALITTAVSADLGTHKSLKGDSRALATVTAIIDGTGSLGAALGPFITGFISKTGWDSVFIMLILCAQIAGACLSGLVKSEIQQIIQNWRNRSTNLQNGTAGKGCHPVFNLILEIANCNAMYVALMLPFSLSHRFWCSTTFSGK
jgi:OPA family glycerol-3-phosphate transporter-like MFS transporter 1/2